MRRDRRFAEHDAVLAHPVERAVGAVLELRLRLLIEILRLGGGEARAAERGSDNRFLPGNYPMHQIPQSDTDRYAVFGQDRLDLAGGRLSIVPGVRVDRYAYRPQADALYLQLNDGYVQRDYTQTHASPKLGAIWHFNNALSLYANYAQGFRPPLYSEISEARFGSFRPTPAFRSARIWV